MRTGERIALDLEVEALERAANLVERHGFPLLASDVRRSARQLAAVNDQRRALEKMRERHMYLEQGIAWLRGLVAELERQLNLARAWPGESVSEGIREEMRGRE